MSDQPQNLKAPLIKVGIVAVVVIAGVLVQNHFRSGGGASSNQAAGKETAPAPAPAANAPSPDATILANVQKLAAAHRAFLRQHPAEVARWADLVGPGKAIDKISVVAGEKYPQSFPPGVPILVTLRDGRTRDAASFVNPGRLPVMPDPAASWNSYDMSIADAPTVLKAIAHLTERNYAGQQMLLGTVFTARLKGEKPPPSEEFLEEIRRFVEDAATPAYQRDIVLQGLGEAQIESIVRLLTRWAAATTAPAMKQRLIGILARPSLDKTTARYEQVWCEADDLQLLTPAADAMAAYPMSSSGIELLLDSALDFSSERAARADLARQALLKMPSPEAAALLVERLQSEPPLSPKGQVLARLLSKLGSQPGAEALVAWIRQCPVDARAFIASLGPRSHHPDLLAGWASALDPGNAFAYAANRDAIRQFLAPPEVSTALPNGSFESGTLDGFISGGTVRVMTAWKSVRPTERRQMVVLDTTENPLTGRAVLASDPVVVPSGMRTLLFDYYFAGTEIAGPRHERYVRARVGPHDELIIAPVFASMRGEASDARLSGFYIGTGFRTAAISVEPWAGRSIPIRVEFALEGEGASARPLGTDVGKQDSQRGTALLLDNLRFSRTAAVNERVDLQYAATYGKDGRAWIRFDPRAVPPRAIVFIRNQATGAFASIDVDAEGNGLFSEPYEQGIDWKNYHVSFAVERVPGEGCVVSPEATVKIYRLSASTNQLK